MIRVFFDDGGYIEIEDDNGNIYCVHTYLDKSDKDLSLDAICKKYKDIGYILDEIGNL